MSAGLHTTLTLLLAVTPSVLLLAFFYTRDRYREPGAVVLATFVLGVATILPVLLYAMLVRAQLPDDFGPRELAAVEAYGLAALPEEACKLAVLVLFVRRSAAFDEPMDGLVYGVAASLGFATLENVIYVSDGGLSLALLRGVTTVPMHGTLGAIMGYYVALSRFGGGPRMLGWAYAVPLVLHGSYNYGLIALSNLAAAGTTNALEQRGLWALVLGVLALGIGWSVWLSTRLRAAQA